MDPEASAALARLRELLRIPTVSYADESLIDWSNFDAFHAALERLMHAVYKRPALQAAIVRNQINTVIRLCFHQDTFSSGFRLTRFHFVVTW